VNLCNSERLQKFVFPPCSPGAQVRVARSGYAMTKDFAPNTVVSVACPSCTDINLSFARRGRGGYLFLGIIAVGLSRVGFEAYP
jgi:hypothetical protein